MRFCVDDGAAPLRVRAWKSQQKIYTSVSSGERAGAIKGEVAAETVIERIVQRRAIKVKTGLEGVMPPDFTEVVGELIDVLNAGLGTAAGESQCEKGYRRSQQAKRKLSCFAV